ncbi:hypothetical protein HGA13_30860 [Nocardia speluncae]|uniref:RHIM domain-containing protein n=1 Tax=Nocardia speluncae TaxID=419477 RepID=A0A846XRS2_9NOCA|nr:hypothetical protein [Nocardia speluncae]NKY37436.1 hypothetical protein [Nocardia speluncae]
MDPFTLIVTALLTGAAAGGQEAASAAVRDAYGALRRRISGDGADVEVTAALEANESCAGSDRAVVEAAVRRARADDDVEGQVLAQRVLDAVPSKQVFNDLRHAQGVHAGDGGTVNVTFHNNNSQ